jgi:uncharacterized protein
MPAERRPDAWILTGGWPGHDPEGVAAWTAERLAELGLVATVVRDLDALLDEAALASLALLVPNWSMGGLSAPQERALVSAVERGLGLAGTHGGMGDAFRNSLPYQWLVGGQFVAHPGDLCPHRIIFDAGSPLLGDLPAVDLTSERYVMLVDPAVTVHARSTIGPDSLPWLEGVQVPVAWTRRWGAGRVAYLSVGHRVDDLRIPGITTAFLRLVAWARADRASGGG